MMNKRMQPKNQAGIAKNPIAIFWIWLSNLGVYEDYTHTEKRSIILLNKINFLLVTLSCLGLVLTFADYIFFHGGQPKLGALRLVLMALTNIISIIFVIIKRPLPAKIITSVFTLFFLITFPSLVGEVNIEYFYYYPSAGAIFSVIPILLFTERKDKKILFITLIYCFLITILADNLLSHFSLDKSLSNMFGNRYVFYKSSQILLFIFTTSVVYNLREINTKYEKVLEEKIALINEQSEELKTSNEELKTTNEELAETHIRLEKFKYNLEELVEIQTVELKESEKRFKSYFTNSLDGIFITDDKGNYLEVNPAAELITGYTKDELLKMNIVQLNVETERQNATERFDKVRSDGHVFESQFRRKDGSLGYWMISAIQLGENRRIGFAKEITERIETEKELKNTKVLLEQTFNQCPTPMILVSMPDAVIRIINPAALDFMGIADEPSYINTSLLDFKASFHDFDKDGNLGMLKDLPLVRSLQGLKTHNEERRLVRKDGTERWELASGVPIYNTQGELIAGYLIMTDITELKKAEVALRESEEKFSKSFRNAPVMFGINDSSGRFIDFNDESLRVAGYKRNEVINRTAVETGWITPKNRARMIHELQTNGRISGLEMEFNAKDGRKVIGLLNGEQITIAGKPCILTVTLDITEQKKAEEALKLSEEKFSKAFNSSPVAIGITKASDSKFIDCNQSFIDLIGYSRRELLSSSAIKLRLWITIEDRIKVLDTYKKNGTVRNEEFNFRQKNGNIITVLYSGEIIEYAGETCLLSILEDITERKILEKKLSESSHLLKRIVDTNPSLIYIYDLIENRNIYVNHEIWEDLGYTPTQVLEMGSQLFQTIMHPDDLPEVVKYHAQFDFASENDVYEIEYRMKHANGDWRWIRSLDVVFLRNSDGKTKQIMGSAIDVTSQKITQDAIRTEKEKAELYLQVAEVILVAFDNKANITLLNRKGYQILGYKEGELTGQNWFKVCLPAEEYETVYNVFLRILAGEMALFEYYENHIITKTGKKRYIAWHNSAIKDSKGNIVGTLSSGEDITERKQAEEAIRLSESKYRRLHTSITDGYAFVNMEGAMVEFNDSFQKMVGYNAEEIKQLTYNDLTPAKWHQFEHDIVENQVIPNGFSQVYQKEYQRKDGSVFPTELRTFLLKNELGENEGMWAIIRDITEKKETERRILHAIIDAEEQERNYFAREIHDGLGPLLSTIRLYLQWLSKPSLKASKSDLLAKANVVIEEALASAKDISHKLSPQVLVNFGLTPAVRSFIDRISGSTTPIINFVSNMEKRLNSDVETTLYRVISECINNSLKHANAKNIEIILLHEPEKIRLMYTDNGVGFDISKKMAQVKGLGLYNMKNRVETLGGSFTIESKRKEGVHIEVQINI